MSNCVWTFVFVSSLQAQPGRPPAHVGSASCSLGCLEHGDSDAHRTPASQHLTLCREPVAGTSSQGCRGLQPRLLPWPQPTNHSSCWGSDLKAPLAVDSPLQLPPSPTLSQTFPKCVLYSDTFMMRSEIFHTFQCTVMIKLFLAVWHHIIPLFLVSKKLCDS